MRKYGYQYDNLNRLTNANHAIPVTNSYNESLQYDKNGNITNLQRTGDLDNDSFTIEIDNLNYNYDTNSNLLKAVQDISGNPTGFKDVVNTQDFYYDANGNMYKDVNKGITSITYNHLNLPTKIIFAGTTKNIVYLYDATGQKVKKVVTNGTTITTTDYLTGYQYENAVLKFFPTAEGYVNNTVVNGINNYNYVYNYTDHLGNIRLSYSKDPVTQQLKILNENNYYPFGMKHEKYNVQEYTYQQITDKFGNILNGYYIGAGNSTSSGLYKYKYNGKEFQDELSLNVYDYGARNYMPDIGRWGNMDNLSGKWATYSPYNYVLNNPIVSYDPNGEDVYLFYYVKSDNKKDNSMFWNSVLTHAKDLLASDEFGEGDIAVYKSISDLGELEKDVEDNISKLSPKYGETREFGIWSHAGWDGPIGSEATSKNGLYRNGDTFRGQVMNHDSPQLNMEGWSNIDFNWASKGSTKAGFYGCNTGNAEFGASFTTTISGLPNFKDVNVWGQTTSSYPSKYTNVRETNAEMREGNFTGQTTYMVSAPPLGYTGRWTTDPANAMRVSRNGKGATTDKNGKPIYQPGAKK